MQLRIWMIGALLASGAFAQRNSFPRPDYFRETFGKTQTKIELKDPVRLKDFVVNGKLELLLKDYLALVMANNTNIQIQLLSVETPKNAIERAFAPWDPTVTASFQSQRNTSPSSNILDGAATVQTLSQPFTARYNQVLDTGMSFNVGYNASKTSTNNNFNSYNPSLTSNLSFGFTQPLLQNRGRYVNRLGLMIARTNLRSAEYSLRNQILQLVQGAENAYWSVVLARENVKVAENARANSQKTLEFAQRQLDLGAISPLDIYVPQQNLAQREFDLTQSKFALAQVEETLRMQMGADLDPDIRKLPIELTETVDLASVNAMTIDREDAVQKALANRPDIKNALQSLDRDDLSISQSKNSLLPNFALTGNYQSQGRGGIFYQRQNVFGGSGSILASTPGGFGDALDQMFHFGFPIYSLGLQLQLPIRSHRASADLADALVRKKTDALTLRNTQEQARLNVLNAVTALEGSKEQLKVARFTRDISQKNLDAARQKYELGAEILQNVVIAENNLSTSESNVVQQQIGLRRNLLNLLTQTGELLDERGIVIQ